MARPPARRAIVVPSGNGRLGNWTGPGTLIFTGILVVRMTRTWKSMQRQVATRIRACKPGTCVIVVRSQQEIDALLQRLRNEQSASATIAG